MRKIRPGPILIFMMLLCSAGTLAGVGSFLLLNPLPLGSMRGVLLVGCWVVFFYLCMLASHRLLMRISPVPHGRLIAGSRDEFFHNIYDLFFLFVFYPVFRPMPLPMPLVRLVHIALGARLGSNTYCSGVIADPSLVTIGDNSLVGLNAALIPHALEGASLAHHPIRMGNNVTIGAHAVILPGVTVGDDAIVAAGAVVTKMTVIGSGEVWGGVPARLIRRRSAVDGDPERQSALGEDDSKAAVKDTEGLAAML